MAFFIVRNKLQKPVVEEEESALIEVSLEERPVVSLTPTEDGHYLNLLVDKILIDAESMDYELLYTTGTGLTQGVPGMVVLGGRDSFEAELLLGSESSGKFRYDEGVEDGTLTLKFRNDKGKLLVKFSTDFHLQSEVSQLTSLDGEFSYEFDKTPDGFFVTMETFGIPDNSPKEIVMGPYGIFASGSSKMAGSAKMGSYEVYRHVTGTRWSVHKSGDDFTTDTGIFVGSSE